MSTVSYIEENKKTANIFFLQQHPRRLFSILFKLIRFSRAVEPPAKYLLTTNTRSVMHEYFIPRIILYSIRARIRDVSKWQLISRSLAYTCALCVTRAFARYVCSWLSHAATLCSSVLSAIYGRLNCSSFMIFLKKIDGENWNIDSLNVSRW